MSTASVMPTGTPVVRAPSSFVPMRKSKTGSPRHASRTRYRSRSKSRSADRARSTHRRKRSPSPPRSGTVKLVNGNYTYNSGVGARKNSRIRPAERRHSRSRERGGKKPRKATNRGKTMIQNGTTKTVKKTHNSRRRSRSR